MMIIIMMVDNFHRHGTCRQFSRGYDRHGRFHHIHGVCTYRRLMVVVGFESSGTTTATTTTSTYPNETHRDQGRADTPQYQNGRPGKLECMVARDLGGDMAIVAIAIRYETGPIDILGRSFCGIVRYIISIFNLLLDIKYRIGTICHRRLSHLRLIVSTSVRFADGNTNNLFTHARGVGFLDRGCRTHPVVVFRASPFIPPFDLKFRP
mmetsp:Transcript_16974/g.32214  ORF Transcript_16974/g.32214 Transcript_16974/m.32214 type:complete len:208 (+) Transcript_16974:589-1212(+)